MTCCDCKRQARFEFRRRDGGVECRCGAHAYPLLSKGCPREYACVVVIPKGERGPHAA